MNKQYKPRVVDVRRSRQSIDEASTTPPAEMATPQPTYVMPPIILRPSWLDLPAQRLVSRITLLGICAIPATLIITATILVAWRLL